MELRIRNLTKSIDGISILKDINLTVRSGEAKALVGANGAGKTSLINCILGIYTEYTGEIRIDGVNVKSKEIDAVKRQMAYMLDTTGLFANLNAWDNLEFYDRFYNTSDTYEERKQRLGQIFQKLSLEGKEKMNIRKFSRGMKQRLAMGRCMVLSPKIIVLDEPYLGLDVEGKYMLTNYLLSLKKSGCSILISSHDLNEIEKFCDTVAFVKNGVIVQEGEIPSEDNFNEKKQSELEAMYSRILM